MAIRPLPWRLIFLIGFWQWETSRAEYDAKKGYVPSLLNFNQLARRVSTDLNLDRKEHFSGAKTSNLQK
jgi:hypothetical protein